MNLLKILLTGIMSVCIAIFLLGIIIISGMHGNLELTALFFFIGGLLLFAYGLLFRKK